MSRIAGKLLLPLTLAGVVLLLLVCSPPVRANDALLDDQLLDLDDFDEDDEELLRRVEQKHVDKELEREQQLAHAQSVYNMAGEYDGYHDPYQQQQQQQEEEQENAPNRAPRLTDPCRGVRCGAGRICSVNHDENKAECICIPECPVELDPRRKVCTNLNETWDSACEVHRQRCLCNTNDPQCRGESVRHVHIDYYGYCKQMLECSESDLADFPRRMRDWLFNVMHDLASRNELPEPYLELEHEAETNMTKRWTNAAIWKWCDLDGHPHDNTVSRHELFPIRAPLMALEHCISPFLESCDPNGDHRISLQEWGKCLGLEEDDLTARCAEITKTDESEKNDIEAAV
ncbi:SPARC-like [Anopheles albimanus]|uniref:SPARC/Testican calcium-binding domain-containing protein n=1 Tax=Anopheles albimanus TaxID=7167 RepID=A0A182FIH2_ANOAL|nr:SPARC-like [Anopheles albimanus]XP_035795821.1 SPARC-like [Anopheles albimanus]XP_035795829.1 SPARC-like [Anopheles albimanus]